MDIWLVSRFLDIVTRTALNINGQDSVSIHVFFQMNEFINYLNSDFSVI